MFFKFICVFHVTKVLFVSYTNFITLPLQQGSRFNSACFCEGIYIMNSLAVCNLGNKNDSSVTDKKITVENI